MAAFSSCIIVTVVCCFRAASQLSDILPFVTVAIDVEVCDPVTASCDFSHFM